MIDQAEKIKLIAKYERDVSFANNEAAKISLLTTLLARLFEGETAEEVIKQFSLGTEKNILNIHRDGKASNRGRADTQYQRVIIEFENNLKITEAHARDQLADYLSGTWNSGNTYNYTLISSDCREWIVYSPDLATAERLQSQTNISADDIVLEERDRLIVTSAKAEEFYYFLDTYLFKSEKQRANLQNIQRDFGQKSDTFIDCYGHLYQYFESVKDTGEVKVAFEQWQRFLSIAYGSFEASERIFIIHSYLSIFAKMLAYEIITRDEHIDDDELRGIIKGTIFANLNVVNFTDNDFFHWVGSEHAFKHLKRAFRVISSKIDTYDFSNVDEDILKGVYQELIDRDTRHSLGEYYTPDWLCERIVDDLEIQKFSKMIDPSCGSGSFLRASIASLRRKFPDLTADQLAAQVCGIDIHPLSVLIAKTTVLLALGKTIRQAKQPITLNVYLADTLLTPTGSVNLDLFGDEFKLWIDDKQYSINTSVFNDPGAFDKAVTIAEDLAEFTKKNTEMSQRAFSRAIKNKISNVPDILINSYYNIYRGLKQAKEEDRDSIWKFIVLNLYKPCFYYQQFDFVIGNPPWFTYSSIGNSQYQSRIKELAAKHNLATSVANMPHLEIAAIFLAHCTNYFLKDEGKLAFVLPRSFFSASHHDSTRSGKALHVRIIDIWDLDGVSPLFNVPSCVLFTERPKANLNRRIPASGRKGKLFRGRLRAPNLNLSQVKDKISVENKKFYYSKLGKSTAFTNVKLKEDYNKNYYQKHFKQGATIVPRNFYFVDITQEYTGSIKGRTLTVRSAKSMEKDAKAPWKNIEPLEGRISTDYLFHTAISRNVLPFYTHNPEKVILPIAVDDLKNIRILNSKRLAEKGDIDTAKWFQQVEGLWDQYKTEKSKSMTASGRLDFQNGLKVQNLRAEYVVLYTASSKDANATVIERSSSEICLIAESKTYAFYTPNADEANYICAFLNANEPNELIKAFQTRGLFGARDVHKKILEVPFPEFDKSNEDHLSLAKAGAVCREKVHGFIAGYGLSPVLGTHELGKARSAIRDHLKNDLKIIDNLIRDIVRA